MFIAPNFFKWILVLACPHAHNFCFLAGNPYPYQPPQYVPPRYIRNPPPPGEPPYPEPYPGYGPDRQYPSQHSGPPFSAHTYAPPSHYSRRHGHYPAPPPPFAQPRDDLVRMSPVPLDVPPALCLHLQQGLQALCTTPRNRHPETDTHRTGTTQLDRTPAKWGPT